MEPVSALRGALSAGYRLGAQLAAFAMNRQWPMWIQTLFVIVFPPLLVLLCAWLLAFGLMRPTPE